MRMKFWKSLVVTLAFVAFGTGAALAQPFGYVANSADDTARVYVANFGDATLSVIDTATNSVVLTTSSGTEGSFLAIAPNGAFAYLARPFSEDVGVFDFRNQGDCIRYVNGLP